MRDWKRQRITWLLAAALLAGGCGSDDDGPDWIHGWKLAEADNVHAQFKRPLPGETGAGVTVLFDKAGQERRFLRMEAVPGRKSRPVRTVEVRYRLTLSAGPAPRLAVVAFEAGGGAYFSIAPAPLEADRYATEQISMASPRPAAFSAARLSSPKSDRDDRLRWDQLDKLWIGLVMDAPTAGRFKVYGANLRSEPWQPRRSLPVHLDAKGAWDLTKDPAVTATLTTPPEGPKAETCMKLEFTLPGHRHMYVLASTSSPAGDLKAYHGLDLRLKARLPTGDVRLLISLTEEGGAQYYFEPAPPGEDDWTQITIPFSAFQPAGWAPDKNERLDLNRILRVTVGVHGTTSEGLGAGWVTAKNLVYALSSEAGPPWPAVEPPAAEPPTKPAKPKAATQPAKAKPATKPPKSKPKPKLVPVKPVAPPATKPAAKPATRKAERKSPSRSPPATKPAAKMNR